MTHETANRLFHLGAWLIVGWLIVWTICEEVHGHPPQGIPGGRVLLPVTAYAPYDLVWQPELRQVSRGLFWRYRPPVYRFGYRPILTPVQQPQPQQPCPKCGKVHR